MRARTVTIKPRVERADVNGSNLAQGRNKAKEGGKRTGGGTEKGAGEGK